MGHSTAAERSKFKILTNLNQRNKGILLGEHQAAVDGLQVINDGIQRKVLLVVDSLEPLEVAVAEERVASCKNKSRKVPLKVNILPK